MRKIAQVLLTLVACLLLVGCRAISEDTLTSTSEATVQSDELTAQIKPVTGEVLSGDLVNETYTVQRDGIELYGVLTAPSNYRDLILPTVIIAHGFNNTLEMYEGYANFLANLGYLVYRFDFYGGSQQSKSGGQDMLDMSVLTELADLEAVVGRLSQEEFVDGTHLNLLGFSQGGVVASLFAAKEPNQVNQLMLVFPAFVLFDDVQETYASYGVSSPSDLPDVISHRNARLGAVYLTDAMTIDLKEMQEKISAPTLIVHGTNDTVVPYAYAEQAVETLADAKLVTVDGGGHWIDEQFNQVSQEAIKDFLDE